MSEIMIPIILFLSLFGFLSVAVWVGARTKERALYYDGEFRKRLIETSPADVEKTLAMLKEEERARDERHAVGRRESLKVAGLVLVAVGGGLWFTLHNLPVEALAGALVPLLVGIALLLYAFVLAPKRPLA